MSEALIVGRVIDEVVDFFTPTVKICVVMEISKFTLMDMSSILLLLLPLPGFTFKEVMTDPDVPGPSDPYLREHLHWKRGGELRETTAQHRHPQVRVPSLPAERQTNCGEPPAASRDYFNTRRFAAENGLGLPVAAVFFNAQRETAARRR
ncbi:UNVERIFIED_CONTAM: CEN-like protein 1 [Sesamum radiatum]|uniref:CEN-like protein 1 n=1 Tax=Sesamum radiatum TaxID=300843 RepID=A0AAW2LAH3_SESRA